MVNTLISLCLFIRNILYRHLLLKIFFKKMGQSRPLFVYFRSFLITISIQIEKSVDGVLGIRTQSRRMVGADETTELWRPPLLKIFVIDSFKYPQHLKVRLTSLVQTLLSAQRYGTKKFASFVLM